MATTTTKVIKADGEERWRNSSIYPEIMVSSYGRVKEREYQHVVKGEGDSFRIYSVPAKMLETGINQAGDLAVNFYTSRGKWVSENVDYLVATEFIPNENPKTHNRIKHIDGNKINSKASNLMWDASGILRYAK